MVLLAKLIFYTFYSISKMIEWNCSWTLPEFFWRWTNEKWWNFWERFYRYCLQTSKGFSFWFLCSDGFLFNQYQQFWIMEWCNRCCIYNFNGYELNLLGTQSKKTLDWLATDFNLEECRCTLFFLINSHHAGFSGLHI